MSNTGAAELSLLTTIVTRDDEERLTAPMSWQVM